MPLFFLFGKIFFFAKISKLGDHDLSLFFNSLMHIFNLVLIDPYISFANLK